MDIQAFMLTSWILPVVVWVAKAYYAPDSKIRWLKLVYHITLGTNLPPTPHPHSVKVMPLSNVQRAYGPY